MSREIVNGHRTKYAYMNEWHRSGGISDIKESIIELQKTGRCLDLQQGIGRCINMQQGIGRCIDLQQRTEYCI